MTDLITRVWSALRDAGLIRHLALTNFDTEHLREIVDYGTQIVSNQVQYSIVDQRPAVKMANYCREHGVWLLSYGTVLGGLLSEKYLGQPEPTAAELNTASLHKYKNMIDAWGGWSLFQELLATLRDIAARHSVNIANVGTRYILDRPAVAGVILGARLGLSEHLQENARIWDFALDDADRAEIGAVTARARDLFALIGDCGDEYR